MTTESFLKIYAVRLLSLLSGFGVMLIVLPSIASDSGSYGIYAFATSLCLFLTYGDIGFLGAGQKYSSEAVGQNDLDSELDYVGFILAFLCLIFLPFTLVMFYSAVHPQFLLPALSDALHYELASGLFYVIAFVVPVQVILQRTVSLIFTVRLKEHVASSIDLVANLLKIAIVPFFFSDGSHHVFGYFLACAVIAIFFSLIGLCVAVKTLQYPMVRLVSRIKFTKRIYGKMKALAFGSAFSTACFVLYYELDLLIVGRYFGVEAVAIYAVAFAFSGFLRNLWVIFYGPFLVLINQLYGAGERRLVKNIISDLTSFTLPFFIVLSIFLVAFSDSIVGFWLGPQYSDASSILKILLVGIAFNGIVQGASIFVTTHEKIRLIYILGAVPCLVYLISFVALTHFYSDLGVQALAMAKSIGSFSLAIAGLSVLAANGIDVRHFWLSAMVAASVAIAGVAVWARYCPLCLDGSGGADIASLLILLFVVGVSIGLVFLLCVVASPHSRRRLVVLFRAFRRSALDRRNSKLELGV